MAASPPTMVYETETTIDAPPDAVWKHPSYSGFNEDLKKRVEGA